MNFAPEIVLLAKLLAVFNLAVLVCSVSISVLAVAKLVLMVLKLSLKPWLLLSCPATG